MISTDDLQAAFEEAGVKSVTIYRRDPSWGSTWVVHANFHGQKLGLSTEPQRDLDKCFRAILRDAPRNPAPSAALTHDDDLGDLL